MKRLSIYAIGVLLTAVFLASCSGSETTKFNVRMTDAPAAYNAVYVDVQEVRAHSDVSGWVTLTTNPGVYNLLDLNNGIDTLIASGNLPVGKVSQIRLILGTNNSIVKDGISYPLSTPSAQQSGLKLNVHETLESGVEYTIWLDFDANRSIVETGNGSFILKPVIRTFTQANTGAITGMIVPAITMSYVYATNGTDTLGTIASSTGYFLIPGVPGGSWTVVFNPTNGQNTFSVPGISVSIGQVTDMGTVIIP